VEGFDFRLDLDRGGGKRTSHGPGEAGPLAAEGGGRRPGAPRCVSAPRVWAAAAETRLWTLESKLEIPPPF
jgi:hypothetical protein